MGDGTVHVQPMGLALNIDGCSGSSLKNHLDEWSTYDWTVSLCGLVVRVLSRIQEALGLIPTGGSILFSHI